MDMEAGRKDASIDTVLYLYSSTVYGFDFVGLGSGVVVFCFASVWDLRASHRPARSAASARYVSCHIPFSPLFSLSFWPCFRASPVPLTALHGKGRACSVIARGGLGLEGGSSFAFYF